VADRRKHGDFWVASSEIEFAYHLAKNAWKGRLSSRQSRRIRILAEELGGERAEEIAGKLFGADFNTQIVARSVDGSLESIIAQAGRRLWRKSLFRHPFQFTSYATGEGFRRVARWFRPTGIFVVILGPDGVGKSTLVGQL